MKKLLTVIAAFALMMPMASAQTVKMRIETTAGATAGTTSNDVPVMASKTYSYVQTIYDASLFGLSGSATIDTLWFNCTSVASSPATDSKFVVYMGHTDKSIAASAKDWLALTEVANYNTTVQPTATGWFAIPLNVASFEYNGTQNLVIAIDREGNEVEGQTYATDNSGSGRLSLRYGNSTTMWGPTRNGTTRAQVPDVRLSVRAARSNRPVENLAVAAVGATSATLTWSVSPDAITPDHFVVEYGLAGFAEGTGTQVNVNETSYTITGLEAARRYDVYVSAVSGSNTSVSRTVQVVTPCSLKALPWRWADELASIDSYLSWNINNNLPLCFDFPGLSTTQAGYPRAYTRVSGDSPALIIRSNGTLPAVAVMPEVDADLNHVRFSYKANNVHEFGYVTDASDASSFVSLGSFETSADIRYVDFEELGVAIPGATRIAIRSTDNHDCSISDITIEAAPACKLPTGFAADAAATTTGSIKLTWGGVQNAGDTYRLYWTAYNAGKDGAQVGSADGITAQEYTVASLAMGTYYDFYLCKICGGSATDTVKLSYSTLGQVNAYANNASYGTVIGSTTGRYGDYGTFTANANEHYHFDHWTYRGNNYTANPLVGIARYNPENPALVAYFEPDVYSVSVATNDGTQGTVSATQGGSPVSSAAYGSTVTFSATPGAGSWVGWSDGSTDLLHNVVVNGNINLEGVFCPAGYAVVRAVLSDPTLGVVNITSGGSPLPANGQVAAGSSIVVRVSVNDPAHYNIGTVTGMPGGSSFSEVSTGTYEATFVASTSVVLGVEVRPLSYALSVSVNDDRLGSASGAGTYLYGRSVNVMAVAGEHCAFKWWADDHSNTTPLRTVTMDGPVSLEAVFEKDSFAVTVARNIDAAGSVEITDGDTRSNTTTLNFGYGDYAFPVAGTNDHYTFSRWTNGNVSHNNRAPYFRVYSNQTWTAMYGYEQVSLTGAVKAPADGTVTPATLQANWSSTVQFTAAEGEHYTFDHWEEGANNLGTANPLTVTVSSAKTYTAVYTPRVYTVTVETDGHGDAAAASTSVAYGENADLTATPSTGYHFDYWEKDGVRINGGATITPVVEGNVTYKAYFAQNIYNVSISASEGGLIVGGSIARTATHGENIVVEALSTNAGLYTFSQWSDGISDNPRTFTVEGNIAVVAQFVTAGAYTISGVADPTEGGVIEYGNGTGSYLPAEVAIIRAIPNANYRFVNWTWAGGSSTSQEYRTNLGANLNMTAHFELVEHRVSIAAAANGHATGAGNYTHGTGATLTAYPNAGYHLVNWTVDGVPTTGDGNVLNIAAVNADMSITPNFAINTYTVSLSGDNVSLDGAGTYDYNAEVTLTATPAEHYDFLRWSNGDLRQSYSFRISDDVTLTAITGQHDYTVSGQSADAAMGSVSGSTTAHVGQVVNLTAVANDHYRFVSWDNASTANPLSVTVDGDVTRTATFAPVHYSVTLVQPAAADGTIVLAAGDSATAVYGTELTYSVSLQPGKKFVRWADGNTQNPRTLVVRGNTTLEAVVEDEVYSVTVLSNNPLYGVTTGTGTYGWHDVVTPTATVNNESLYQFISWGDGESNATHSAITIENDVNLTAIFGERDAYTIALLCNDNTMGSATATAYTAHDGDEVTITAAANANYHFVQWSDGNSEAVRTLTVHNNVVLTATFAINQYTLTLNNGTNGHVSGATSGMVDHGSSVTFFAQADQNYHFVYWMDENGDSVAVENPLTVTMTADATYEPLFAKDRYEISAEIAVGTIDGADTYEHGTPVTLTATLPANYDFLGWSINGVAQPGTSLTLTFTATENAHVVATVGKHQYQLAASSHSNAMGYITGSANGSYDFDQTFSVTAVPTNAAQYQFDNWNNDASMNEATVDSNFTAGDVTLEAYFSVRSYDLAVGTEGDGQVSAVSGTYDYGTMVTVEATPGTGMAFSHWSDDYSNTNPRTLQVTGDMAFNAVFVPADYMLTLASNDMSKGTVVIDSNNAATYRYGDMVKLHARTLNSDTYKFNQWQDGVTDSIRTITITGDAVYTAFFGMANMLSVNVLGTEGGGAQASQTSVYNNTDVTIDTADVQEHYHFVGWYNAAGELVFTATQNVITVTSDTLLTARYALDTHYLDVTASDYGTVTGAGWYSYGATATVFAQADSKCHFVGWSDGESASVNPRQVVMNGDVAFTALFERDMVTITASAVNGTLDNYSLDVYVDSTFSITATADEHYSNFKGWTRNGVLVGTDETLEDVATANAAYVATFAIDTVNLTVNTNDVAMGSVNGATTGKYTYGTAVTLTAVPAAHHHFVNWNGDDEMDDVSIDTILNSNVDMTAYFAINSASITIAVAGGQETWGTVNDDVNGEYDYGEVVTIEATPATGFRFVKWSDNDINPVRSITIGESSISLTAQFDYINYDVRVNVSDPTMAWIEGAQPVYHYGDVVTFVAHNRDTNLYKFVGWSDNGSTDTMRTETITGDLDITARFSNRDKWNVFVQSENMSKGTVEGSGSYNNNETAHLVAHSAAHYHFLGWSNGATDSVYDITVTSDTSLIAYFEVDTHKVTLFATQHGTLGGAGWYDYGTQATLTATPEEHYQLRMWTNADGDSLSNANPYVVTVESDMTLSAVFELKTYTLTVSGEHTQVTGGGDYTALTSATLTAVADDDYTFSHWTKNGVYFTAEADTTFVVEESAEYVAVSTENAAYTVYVQSANISEGTVNGNGSYHVGNMATVTATPAEHYHFAYWMNMGAVVSTESTYTFAVSEEMADNGIITMTAYFAVDTFEVTFSEVENGTLSGEGSYAWNSPVTLTATPDQHYDLVRWVDADGNTLGTAEELSFNMPDSNITVGAEFGLHTYNVTASAINGSIVRGGGALVAFSTDTIVAQADENYHLLGWQIDGVSVADAESDTLVIASVEGDYNVVAVYGIDGYSFAFSVNDNDLGDVMATADGMYTMGGTYNNGTAIEMVARKRGHNDFVAWVNANGGDTLSTNDTLAFILTQDTNITAIFEPHMYEVAAVVDPVENADSTMGYTLGSGFYGWQSLAMVSAVASEGYHFTGWSDGVTTAERQIYVTSDTTVVAYFAINTYNVVVEVNDTNMGYVTGAGEYNYGDTARLYAYAADHCQFEGFNGSADQIDSLVFVVTGDVTVTATFGHSFLNLYTSAQNGTVSVLIEGNPANVEVQPMQAVYNDSIVLTAQADSNYRFAYWVITSIDFDTQISNVVVVDSTWLDSTYIDDDGVEHEVWDSTYHIEEVVTVNQIRTEVGRDYANPMGMRITDHTDIQAVCELNTYTVTLMGEYVELVGAGVVNHGDSVTITATGTDFHHFVAWVNLDGDTISTDNPYTFVVTSDTTLVALTALDSMHLTVTCSEGGSVTGGGDYEYGAMATIVAVPDSGYYFIRWSDGDTNATREVYVYEDLSFHAIFYHIGIDDIDFSNVSVYAAQRAIIVKGAAKQTVRVFDAVGRQVVSTVADSDILRMPMEATGIYMVQIGNSRARRVMVMQ